jgi:hypothetical protein
VWMSRNARREVRSARRRRSCSYSLPRSYWSAPNPTNTCRAHTSCVGLTITPKTEQIPNLLNIQVEWCLIDCRTRQLFKLAHPSHVTFTPLDFKFHEQYRLFIYERMVWHKSCYRKSEREATKYPKSDEILTVRSCDAPLYGTS